jgi:FkbM family methyltransferase
MRKLTIGMVTYDDYDGVYFSIQAIRMYHKEILNEIEFVIIDNNPTEPHGKGIKNLCGWIKEPIQYIPFTEYKSTAIRSKIFEYANTPYVLVMDCHVMFEAGSIKKLIDYFDSGKDDGNLLQGPMIYDDLINLSTHFDLVWRAQMWGIWATDERGKNPNNEPFEIPAQGLGSFSCRKDSWLGFNPKFRGFGGEEGYIHEKYRKAGKKAMCVPFLRWLHRFGRPSGVKYPLSMEFKVKNYVFGFNEIGLNTKDVYDHFKEFTTTENLDKWFLEAGDKLDFKVNQPKKLPIEYVENRKKYILFKNDVGVTDMTRRGGIYEHYIFDYIKNNLRVYGKNIIDVGANFGFHSMEFSDLVGNGKVYAFEPQKLVYYQLCGNIILNGYENITAYNLALSDTFTNLKMENLQYHSSDKINIGNAHLDAYYSSGYNDVDVKPLDSFEFQNVAVLKIDVQGYEPKVLDGAMKTIQKNKPVIFIEAETAQLQIYQWKDEDIFNRLNLLGYEYKKIIDAPHIVDYVAVPK